MAMVAVAAYLWEEGLTHAPLINIPSNRLLLEPIYDLPTVRDWLDDQFVDFMPH